MMNPLAPELRRLDQELKRLRGDQGRIARRNARHSVLRAIRLLRDALDEVFPHERKIATTSRRARRLATNQSTFAVSTSEAVRIAALGIKVEPVNNLVAAVPMWVGDLWSADPRPPLKDIKRARRDIPFRHSLLARTTLSRMRAGQP